MRSRTQRVDYAAGAWRWFLKAVVA